MPEPHPELTQLLQAVGAGDDSARERLYENVYASLRGLAEQEFRRETPHHTLQPTALAHEAYVRLVGNDGDFENRAHFFGAAARAMRRILVDHARGNHAIKRGGHNARETLVDFGDEGQTRALEIDDALHALGEKDARLAEVVHLRFFGGLNVEEVAKVLDISTATVKRDWKYARAWLMLQLSDADSDGDAY